MENDRIVKIAAWVIVGSVVVPIVIGAAALTGTAIINGLNKARFKKRIKQGLKDGSIVEIDGQYYDVEKTVEEA